MAGESNRAVRGRLSSGRVARIVSAIRISQGAIQFRLAKTSNADDLLARLPASDDFYFGWRDADSLCDEAAQGLICFTIYGWCGYPRTQDIVVGSKELVATAAASEMNGDSRFDHEDSQATRRSYRQDRIRDHLRRRRTPGDPDINREHRIKRPDSLGRGREDAASQGAIAESRHKTWLGHRVIRHPKGTGHPARHRPGHEQNIGMARRGDNRQPEALQVVLGSGSRIQLLLTGVA